MIIKDEELSIPETLIIRLLTSVLMTAGINMILSENTWNSISFVTEFSRKEIIFMIICLFVAISISDLLIKNISYYKTDIVLLVITTIWMSIYMLCEKTDVYLCVAVVLFTVIIINYAMRRFPISHKKMVMTDKKMWLTVGMVLLITAIYLGSLLVLRFYLFRTPTYDFGIFAQMFHNMKETLLPDTTCERSYLLSHFAVHFSPIFYFVLPIYMIFPSPVTLIIVQLLFILSGIIPIYKICKERKFSTYITASLMIVYILYPTLRSGLFYDFHENKFLPTLILWLLYFMDTDAITEKKKYAGIFIFLLLCLFVKEDAAIYTACIGLFNLSYKNTKKEKITGGCVFCFSVIYFLIVYKCLGEFGEGKSITSIGRYNNLMVTDKDGIVGLVMNMITNPGYAIAQIVEKDKLQFILWTMGPLMFIPLLNKKISVLILAIPYAVINLLTDYGYQYNIGFQYTYGSCTLLMYMVILWFDGKENLKKKRMATIMCVSSLLFSVNAIADRNLYYDDAKLNLESNLEIKEVFESIPKDASVKADTWFVAHLCDRKEVYDYDYTDKETDYIVLDMRSAGNREKKQEDIEKMYKRGYELYKEIEEKVIILYKK